MGSRFLSFVERDFIKNAYDGSQLFNSSLWISFLMSSEIITQCVIRTSIALKYSSFTGVPFDCRKLKRTIH